MTSPVRLVLGRESPSSLECDRFFLSAHCVPLSTIKVSPDSGWCLFVPHVHSTSHLQKIALTIYSLRNRT